MTDETSTSPLDAPANITRAEYLRLIAEITASQKMIADLLIITAQGHRLGVEGALDRMSDNVANSFAGTPLPHGVSADEGSLVQGWQEDAIRGTIKRAKDSYAKLRASRG